MGYPNEVTEEFLHGFKAGDVVDVREVWRRKRVAWSGPHKLLVYKLEPPSKDAKPAAYLEIVLDGKKLKRRLIVGDQQVIRKHIPEVQKQGLAKGEWDNAIRKSL